MLTYNMENRGAQSKFEYLYALIRADIRAGRLLPGERMPSKRALAEHLGVSVITVESAYTQLVMEGYVTSRARSGFFVSEAPMPPSFTKKEKPAALLPEMPDARDGAPQPAFQFSAFARIMRQVINEYSEKLLQKPPHLGCPELRNAISEHLLGYRGMYAPPERIVIGSGAEYLYGLLSQLFAKDAVFGVEHPSYEKIRLVYEANGTPCELLEMDENGVSSESLASTRADVLHVTPYHSYPSGVTASAAKRREYIAWANARDGFIIEDDFDSEFSLSKKPAETVYAMDGSGRVIYLNTFSKSLAPSMRMGYMILPETLLARYEEKLGFYSCTVPVFDQYVLAEFIAQGYFEKHLNRIRRRMRQTKNAARWAEGTGPGGEGNGFSDQDKARTSPASP